MRRGILGGVTVFLGALVLAGFSGSTARAEVLLSDIVGGGDGSGNAPVGNIGISADDGTFRTGHLDGVPNTGENFHIVDDAVTEYIDSVFIFNVTPFPVSAAGYLADPPVTFDFLPEDPWASTWNHILKDMTHDVDKGLGDIFLSCQAFDHAVGIHAAAGVTFDLEAIRAKQANPADVGYFSSFIGKDRCNCDPDTDINNYVILSDDTRIIDFFQGHYLGGANGEPVQMLVPPEAKYLTLATGAAGDGICCDHGVFANAKLSRAPKVEVTRDIPDVFQAGDILTVILDVNVLEPVNEIEIREVVPSSFLAENPSPPGVIEEKPSPGRQTIVWKLTGAQAVNQGLTYDLTVPDPFPTSCINRSGLLVEGRPEIIVGDQEYAGGRNGFMTETLAITLRQPTTGCAGDDPGLGALRQDYLTDGDAVNEVTVVPVQGESVSPDFGVDSPSIGGVAPASTVWNRMLGQGWFELNAGDPNDVMSYLAYYVVNPRTHDVKVTIGSGSDDSQQILLDGSEVWINNVARGNGAAQVQDRSAVLDLAPGKHLLLQKVFEGCGGFNASLRFEDEDGNPLLVKSTLDPAADRPALGDPAYEAGQAFVFRRIPSNLDVGESGRITLKLRVRQEGFQDATVEENVPPGFVISDISGGGRQEGQKITWTISGALSNRDLGYRVAIPEGSMDADFGGRATLAGKQDVILGDRRFSRGVMNDAGFIKHWLVLGPLDTFNIWPGDPIDFPVDPEGTSATPENNDLRKDFLAGGGLTEGNIRPFDGMRISPGFDGDGVTGSLANGLDPLTRACAPASPTWERFLPATGTFDHNAYFGEDINSHATYAACYIRNNTAADLPANIAIDSDDAFIAFLNGQEAVAYEPGPCSSISCGRGMGGENMVVNVAPVVLRPGENFLLTRTHDGFGGSGHRLRFQDDQGAPLLAGPITVSLKSAETPPAGYVRRVLSSDSYQSEASPITVTLKVEVSGARDITVTEMLPPGWSAGDVSHGGSAGLGRVTWTLNALGQNADLTYRLVPGSCPEGGSWCGNGPGASEYTVNGVVHSLRGDESFRRETKATDLLEGWEVRDIGCSGGGTVRVGDQALDVSGRGQGIKTTTLRDEFRFVSTPVSGDFEISTRIDCLGDPGGLGQGGLMVRDTFDTFSAFVFLGVGTDPAGANAGVLNGLMRRDTKKTQRSARVNLASADVPSLPVHLKLKRAASRLTLHRSSDGLAYSEIAGMDIGTAIGQVNLKPEVLLGLAVSGQSGGATRIDYRGVAGTPPLPPFRIDVGEPAPCPPALTAAAGGSRQVTLSWTAPAAACGPPPTGYSIYRDGAKVADVAASPTSYVDGAGLADNTRYCYRVRSRAAARESGDSNEICATTGPVGKLFRRGDLNTDQAINLTDAINLLGALFLGSPELITCRDAADVDDSGNLNLTDAIYLLSYSFQGGDEPPAPGPKICGLDPTADSPLPPVNGELGCLSETVCVSRP